MHRKIHLFLTILNIAGLLVSAYLLYMHLAPEATSVCTISQSWNCDLVNKSVYATTLGIPNAVLGVISYLIFIIFSIRGLFKDNTQFAPYFLGLVSIGLLFSLYLTGIEAFVLKTFCLFCVAQQIIIAINFVLALLFFKTSKDGQE